MAWFILFTNAQKHNNPLSIYKNEEFTHHGSSVPAAHISSVYIWTNFTTEQ